MKGAKLQAPKFPRGGLREQDAEVLEDEEVYRGAVWEGTALAGQPLQAVSFEGCIFREVNLSRVRWERVRLTDVRLEGCDLSGAEWLDGSLERVEVVNCRAVGWRAPAARLRHVRFARVQAQLSVWLKADAQHFWLEDSDLTEADFMEAKLTGTVFRSCRLGRADFQKAQLQEADLRGSDLRHARLTEKELPGVLVEALQLLELAHLLGVTVRELDA